jgi:hypothetical protein
MITEISTTHKRWTILNAVDLKVWILMWLEAEELPHAEDCFTEIQETVGSDCSKLRNLEYFLKNSMTERMTINRRMRLLSSLQLSKIEYHYKFMYQVFLENLTLAQLVNIFLSPYETRMHIIVFTKAPPLGPILCQINPVHTLTCSLKTVLLSGWPTVKHLL